MSQPRDHWSSRAGFVLAAAGSAIGLGNLWKFPYIAWENDGGAFVLVYLVCIALVGLPIMLGEILLGRRSQKSAVGAIKEAAGKNWGFVGGLGVFTGFVILGYYAVIAGWGLRNFVMCLGWTLNGFPAQADLAGEFGLFLADWKAQFVTTVLFMAATVFVVLRGIGKGIESVSRRLMPLLMGILLLVLASALSMEGAGEALQFVFAPNFGELDINGVLEALGHSFFTLSLGMGAMITYGSYMGRDESIIRSSLVVVVLDTLIALVAAVAMFSVIFSVAGLQDQLGRSSVGMLFITLPSLFYNHVPLGSLLAPLFYILVSFAALTSTISILEVVAAYFIDERGMTRPRAVALTGGGTLILSVLCSLSLGAWGPISNFEIFPGKAGLLSTLDHLASNWLLPVGGLLTTIIVGWVLSAAITKGELVDDNTPTWFRYDLWRLVMRYVVPVAVGAIIIAVILGRDFS